MDGLNLPPRQEEADYENFRSGRFPAYAELEMVEEQDAPHRRWRSMSSPDDAWCCRRLRPHNSKTGNEHIRADGPAGRLTYL